MAERLYFSMAGVFAFPLANADTVRAEVTKAEPVLFAGHYYQVFSRNEMNWDEAAAFCRDKGGYLASITSAAEDQFTEELNTWIDENLGDDVIDEWYDENREDQENYFEIQGRLIRMMHEQFPNIHPSYIEELAEERYNSYLEHSAYESPEDVPEVEESDEDDSEGDETLDAGDDLADDESPFEEV